MEYCDKCGWIKPQCQCEEPMTNADRIRDMTDEELAEFIEDVTGSYTPCRFCNPITKEDGHCNLACDDGVLNWVKAEVVIE